MFSGSPALLALVSRSKSSGGAAVREFCHPRGASPGVGSRTPSPSSPSHLHQERDQGRRSRELRAPFVPVLLRVSYGAKERRRLQAATGGIVGFEEVGRRGGARLSVRHRCAFWMLFFASFS